MPKYKFKLNGVDREVEAPEEMPLLWVLRDMFGLTGTKFGCGVGSCGCCTVLMNDEAEKSCSLPVSACAGKSVVTVEGLSKNGNHPLQKAWIDQDVPQCGYCQAGQIMAAAALLKEIPKPTDQDIDDFMTGNLCRCGTYQRIREAIKEAAK